MIQWISEDFREQEKAGRNRRQQLWLHFLSSKCHLVEATFPHGPSTVLIPVEKRRGTDFDHVFEGPGAMLEQGDKQTHMGTSDLTPGRPALTQLPGISMSADHFPQSAVREEKTLCTFIQNKYPTVTLSSFDL